MRSSTNGWRSYPPIRSFRSRSSTTRRPGARSKCWQTSMGTQDFRRWLIPSARVHTNVEITAFLTAEAYYNALRSLIDKTGKGDLIFLSGWEMDIHQPFGANLPSVDSVQKVLAAAANRGAKIRALLDEDQHVAAAKLVSELTKGVLGPELTDADKFRDAKNREAVKAISDLGGQALHGPQTLT